MTTEIRDKNGNVIGTSIDRFMRDGDLDLWRWENNFAGIPPLVGPTKWIIIWRPDKDAAYHDKGAECILNDNEDHMTPRPYDWLLFRVVGNEINWLWNSGEYEGLQSDVYNAKFIVKAQEDQTFDPVKVEVDVIMLRDSGSIVRLNGTIKTNNQPIPTIDVSFISIIDFFERNVELRPAVFIPSPHCTGGKPLGAPPKTSDAFAAKCYAEESSSSAGSRAIASLAAVLLLLIFALFF